MLQDINQTPLLENVDNEGRCIRNIQQDFAENLGNQNEVIWDLLSGNQEEILKNKFKELIPDPVEETNKEPQNMKQKIKNSIKSWRSKPDIELLRESIFNKVWAQRKYTNRNSLTAIIYVFVTPEDNIETAKLSKKFSCHPVVRTRKCVANDDSSECCMVFIDEVGRVYANWAEYKKNNELPPGMLVAPTRGVYSLDDAGYVKLEVCLTPAARLGAKVLKGADTTAATAGLVSIGVPIAALCAVPVAAPVMLGAAVVGLATAGYSAIRSSGNLIDRSQHDQSISLADRQARGNWLGVLGGFVGLGAAGATRIMTTAAIAGNEISLTTQLVVNGMNISTIVLSGSAVANGVLDLLLRFSDDEEISTLDALQLASSLVLFTHSVYNFQLASTLINDTRNKTIQDYRKGLSNRQRRMFDKISKETIRIRGETHGKMDIIRNVNDIPSKQYLNDLFKVNSELNKQNVRPAFGSASEGIVLNNEVPVNTQILRNNVPDVMQQVTQPIPPAHGAGQAQSGDGFRSTQALFARRGPAGVHEQGIDLQSHLSSGVRGLMGSVILVKGVKIAFSDYNISFFEHIINAESFENVVTTIGNYLSDVGLKYLLNLAQQFIDTKLEDIQRVLRMFIAVESVLYRMLLYCMENYRNQTLEFLERHASNIIDAVEKYFLSLSPHNYPDLLQQCKVCSGFFAICNLD